MVSYLLEEFVAAMDCSPMFSLSVEPSVTLCDPKLSLSDSFKANYKGNCLMFLIFCCFVIIKYFDVSHRIRHETETLGTRLSPVSSLEIEVQA